MTNKVVLLEMEQEVLKSLRGLKLVGFSVTSNYCDPRL